MLHYCLRRQLLAAKGVDIAKPPWLARKLSLHGGSHDNLQMWVQEALQPRFSEVMTEMPIYDSETRCGGHIDVVAADEKEAYVIELKTYAYLGKDPTEGSYWQHQVSFYYHTVAKQYPWPYVQPLVVIATFTGDIRVIEPTVTTDYQDILSQLNLAWEANMLPSYRDCQRPECDKCPLKRLCTEPVDTVDEFAEMVIAFSQE